MTQIDVHPGREENDSLDELQVPSDDRSTAKTALGILSASARLTNPFSNKHVISGEEHSRGRYPFKKRLAVYPLLAAGFIALGSNDYQPTFGQLPPPPAGTDTDDLQSIGGMIEDRDVREMLPVRFREHVEEILASYEVPFQIAADEARIRYPELEEVYSFRSSAKQSEKEDVPLQREQIQFCILELSKYDLTEEEALALAPELLESGSYLMDKENAETLGQVRESFSLNILMQYLSTRESYSAEHHRARREKIRNECVETILGSVEGSNVIDYLRKNSRTGPIADAILLAAADAIEEEAISSSPKNLSKSFSERFTEHIIKRVWTDEDEERHGEYKETLVETLSGAGFDELYAEEQAEEEDEQTTL